MNHTPCLILILGCFVKVLLATSTFNISKKYDLESKFNVFKIRGSFEEGGSTSNVQEKLDKLRGLEQSIKPGDS